MEYTVQNLEYAVSVFYNSENNEKAQAHQWLTNAQRCPEAWSFVWDLLQSGKGTEVQFFAATTLHTKLLRCWSELPPESYEELKTKIMQAVLAYATGPKIVLNRLCISLAAFILQQGNLELAEILRPLSSPETMSLLLEVLTVIPEEFNSMTMGSELRTRNRISLQQACPAVLDDMLRCLQSSYNCSKEPPSEETVQSWYSAAHCASSWLSLGGEQESLKEGGVTIPLTDCLPLCHALFNVVFVLYTHHEAISDSALEACEAALGAVRAAGASADAAHFPAAALQLLAELAELCAPIVQRDNVPNSINEELLAAISTCAVALGESHTLCIVKAMQTGEDAGARQFIELLLQSQAAPGHYPLHETRSQLVFSLWYLLQDEILLLLETDSSKEVNEVWKQVFTRLLTILINKSEAPAEEALSRDDAELLRCYRQDVADTVMYCYGILGDWCWSVVEAAWTAASTDAAREAALHVFLALADAASQQSASPHVPAMLSHAVSVAASCSNARLLRTALECLGSYASWLSSSPAHLALARRALTCAGDALPRAPRAAALALKKLSLECSEAAAPLASQIAAAAQSGCGRSDAWLRRQLLVAAGAALAGAERSLAAALLSQLADQIRDELTAQAAEPTKCPGCAEAAASLLCALTPQPWLAAALFRTLLPALPPHATNPALVPSLFLVLKQAVTVLMDDCLPMLGEVAELAFQGIETQPCPSGVDIVKLIVLMYDTQWAGCGRLLHACAAAAGRACAADPASRSDLTEALFGALLVITKKKPHYIDALDDLMPQLVDLGCDCIRLWEAGAARAACGWLGALSAARPAALRPLAPALTQAALKCIGGATPRNQIGPLAELLLALNRARWSEGEGAVIAAQGGAGEGLSTWLKRALQPPGFPTIHATDEHKHKFMAAVIKEKSSKRRILETVQEFSLVCRGLIGTEYARQTLLAKQLVA